MERSSPAWRVFDAPTSGGDDGGLGAGSATEASSKPASSVGVQPIVLLAIAASILVGGAAVGLAIAGAGSSTVAGPGGTHGAIATQTTGVDTGGFVVDVVGAVVAPGVYHLPAGSRIEDAIQAAGGLSPRVDANRLGAELNLAATLADGAQIRVPSRDDPADPGGQPGGGSPSGGGGTSGGGAGALINLNTATQSELESLPGIGPVTAGKIIEARSQAPFAAVDELRGRGLVGEKTFEALRSLVTVG